jgi:hypothetical protein
MPSFDCTLDSPPALGVIEASLGSRLIRRAMWRTMLRTARSL